MIRKRVGDQFWLIRQSDHARVAGDLARHVGNKQFARPDDPEHFAAAVAEHDTGWDTHDNAPTRSPAGHPLDVFETPRPLAHRVWSESARLAYDHGPYIALLVSLHQLGLSALATAGQVAPRYDEQHLRQQFDTNKFQHAIIEQTETLRAQIGLRTDRPLKLGLAEGWNDPGEQKLAHQLRLLQALDLMSLAALCDMPPVTQTAPVFVRPGGQTTSFKLHRPTGDTLLVRPWLFDEQTIIVSAPARIIPARVYASDEELLDALHAAEIGHLDIMLRPV